MFDKELDEIVRIDFSFIFENFNGKIIKKIYDKKYFGNEIVEVKINKIIIRFVKDRSQIFINIGYVKDKKNMYDFNLILEYLKLEKTMNFSLIKNQIELQEASKNMDSNFKIILEFLESEKYKEIINKLNEQRSK